MWKLCETKKEWKSRTAEQPNANITNRTHTVEPISFSIIFIYFNFVRWFVRCVFFFSLSLLLPVFFSFVFIRISSFSQCSPLMLFRCLVGVLLLTLFSTTLPYSFSHFLRKQRKKKKWAYTPFRSRAAISPLFTLYSFHDKCESNSFVRNNFRLILIRMLFHKPSLNIQQHSAQYSTVQYSKFDAFASKLIIIQVKGSKIKDTWMTPSDNGERKVAFLAFGFIIRAHVSIFFCVCARVFFFLRSAFAFIVFFFHGIENSYSDWVDCDQLHDSNIPNIYHDFCALTQHNFLLIYFASTWEFFPRHRLPSSSNLPIQKSSSSIMLLRSLFYIFPHLLMFDFGLSVLSAAQINSNFTFSVLFFIILAYLFHNLFSCSMQKYRNWMENEIF